MLEDKRNHQMSMGLKKSTTAHEVAVEKLVGIRARQARAETAARTSERMTLCTMLIEGVPLQNLGHLAQKCNAVVHQSKGPNPIAVGAKAQRASQTELVGLMSKEDQHARITNDPKVEPLVSLGVVTMSVLRLVIKIVGASMFNNGIVVGM